MPCASRTVGLLACALVGCASPGEAPVARLDPAPSVIASAAAPIGSAPPVDASAPRASASASAVTPVLPPGLHPWTFEDMGLPGLVNVVSAITGKRILLTGTLPEIHATSDSPEPITTDEVWAAFLTILQANGLTVVARGSMWVVVPSASILNH